MIKRKKKGYINSKRGKWKSMNETIIKNKQMTRELSHTVSIINSKTLIYRFMEK